jgi:hypothetical protein
MIYALNSKLRSRGDVLRIGRQVERWCRLNMGINNRKKYQPLITYYKSLDEDSDMGEYRYWDNEIIIYYNNCGSVRNLIRTILHEWKHQLQPMSRYERVLDEVGYEDHPFEKEAEAAELDYKKVWICIKPKINKI